MRKQNTKNQTLFQRTHSSPLDTIPWYNQLLKALPFVLPIVFILQLLAMMSFFDTSNYNNHSIELQAGSINTVVQKIFVILSFLSLLTLFVGWVFSFVNKKYSLYFIILFCIFNISVGAISLNLLSVIVSLSLIFILLRVLDRYEIVKQK